MLNSAICSAYCWRCTSTSRSAECACLAMSANRMNGIFFCRLVEALLKHASVVWPVHAGLCVSRPSFRERTDIRIRVPIGGCGSSLNDREDHGVDVGNPIHYGVAYCDAVARWTRPLNS